MSWLRKVREYLAPSERDGDLRDVQGASDDTASPAAEAVILIDGGLEHVVPVESKSHQMVFGGRTWHHVTEREGVWVYRPTK